MPAYFFHLFGDEPPLIDTQGIDLPDLEAARMSAVYEAREIMKAGIFEGCLPLHLRFDVTSATGALLFTVPFDMAVHVRWREGSQTSAAVQDTADLPQASMAEEGPRSRWLIAASVGMFGGLALHSATAAQALGSGPQQSAYDLAFAVVLASLAWLRTSLLRY